MKKIFKTELVDTFFW